MEMSLSNVALSKKQVQRSVVLSFFFVIIDEASFCTAENELLCFNLALCLHLALLTIQYCVQGTRIL